MNIIENAINASVLYAQAGQLSENSPVNFDEAFPDLAEMHAGVIISHSSGLTAEAAGIDAATELEISAMTSLLESGEDPALLFEATAAGDSSSGTTQQASESVVSAVIIERSGDVAEQQLPSIIDFSEAAFLDDETAPPAVQLPEQPASTLNPGDVLDSDMPLTKLLQGGSDTSSQVTEDVAAILNAGLNLPDVQQNQDIIV